MALSNVDIELLNGRLGAAANTADGTAGLILTGVALDAGAGATGVELNTPYLIGSLQDAERMGITADYDSTHSIDAYKQIREFYSQHPSGSALLYFMVVANTVTLAQMVDRTSALYSVALLNFAQGKIKILGISRRPNSEYNPAIVNEGQNPVGMDPDSEAAITNAQALATEFAEANKPFRCIVPIRLASNVNTLKDLTTGTNNRVMAVIGATDSSNQPAVGLMLGRAAAIPVQRSLGRVKDGNVGINNAFIAGIGANTAQSEANLNLLHDKGYVFFRSFNGLDGWFISSDRTATGLSDDYAYLAAGRTIDKASVLAYTAMVQELNDDVEVDDSGKLTPGVVGNLQEAVENTISLNMLRNNEISSVSAFVDPAQNILATGRTEVDLDIIPRGTNRTIKVKLGFLNPSA